MWVGWRVVEDSSAYRSGRAFRGGLCCIDGETGSDRAAAFNWVTYLLEVWVLFRKKL